MRRPLPLNRPALPRVAYGDPVKAARMLADLIPAIIAQAEGMGADEIVGHLRMALAVAERRAAEGQPDSSSEVSMQLRKTEAGEAN